MAALPVPATYDEAINLFFREKAFWTFSRGQRLGDLRRLIRQYNRTAEQHLPEWQSLQGRDVWSDVNLPVPQAEENNPNVLPPGRAIDRNA